MWKGNRREHRDVDHLTLRPLRLCGSTRPDQSSSPVRPSQPSPAQLRVHLLDHVGKLRAFENPDLVEPFLRSVDDLTDSTWMGLLPLAGNCDKPWRNDEIGMRSRGTVQRNSTAWTSRGSGTVSMNCLAQSRLYIACQNGRLVCLESGGSNPAACTTAFENDSIETRQPASSALCFPQSGFVRY